MSKVFLKLKESFVLILESVNRKMKPTSSQCNQLLLLLCIAHLNIKLFCQFISQYNLMFCSWDFFSGVSGLIRSLHQDYDLNGSWFESSYSHLNLRYCTYFKEGVSWDWGNCREWICSKRVFVIKKHSLSIIVWLLENSSLNYRVF